MKNPHLNPKDLPKGVISKVLQKLPMKEIKPSKTKEMDIEDV